MTISSKLANLIQTYTEARIIRLIESWEKERARDKERYRREREDLKRLRENVQIPDTSVLSDSIDFRGVLQKKMEETSG